MSNDWRPIVGIDRGPVQQGLVTDPADYEHYQMNSLMLGVILEVYPSDSELNRTAHISEQRRGFYHEAKVLLVNTNSSSNLLVDHAVICPSVHTGLDDYYEHLPRGSSNRVDGERYVVGGANVDPYDLDGDWCVVGFMGGSLDQPFIVAWWPHPRNVYDAATSGNANANRTGVPQSLDQKNRYFRRINGVEHVVTGRGDIYLSTTYANSDLRFGTDIPATKGRFPRSLKAEEGGSILLEVKPTQTLELSWDEQIDGAGIRRGSEAELPQTNPPPTTRQNASATPRTKTYVKIDQEEFRVDVPEDVKVTSGKRVRIFCEDTTTLFATNLLELEAAQVSLAGTSGITLDSDTGNISLSAATLVDLISQAAMNLTASGAITIGGSSVTIGPSTPGAGTISSTDTGVALGTGAVDAIVRGTALDTAWAPVSTTLTAVPAAADLASAITLANANKAAILALIAALAGSLSTTNTTG